MKNVFGVVGTLLCLCGSGRLHAQDFFTYGHNDASSSVCSLVPLDILYVTDGVYASTSALGHIPASTISGLHKEVGIPILVMTSQQPKTFAKYALDLDQHCINLAGLPAPFTEDRITDLLIHDNTFIATLNQNISDHAGTPNKGGDALDAPTYVNLMYVDLGGHGHIEHSIIVLSETHMSGSLVFYNISNIQPSLDHKPHLDAISSTFIPAHEVGHIWNRQHGIPDSEVNADSWAYNFLLKHPEQYAPASAKQYFTLFASSRAFSHLTANQLQKDSHLAAGMCSPELQNCRYPFSDEPALDRSYSKVMNMVALDMIRRGTLEVPDDLFLTAKAGLVDYAGFMGELAIDCTVNLSDKRHDLKNEAALLCIPHKFQIFKDLSPDADSAWFFTKALNHHAIKDPKGLAAIGIYAQIYKALKGFKRENGDLRTDLQIRAEVAQNLKQHGLSQQDLSRYLKQARGIQNTQALYDALRKTFGGDSPIPPSDPLLREVAATVIRLDDEGKFSDDPHARGFAKNLRDSWSFYLGGKPEDEEAYRVPLAPSRAVPPSNPQHHGRVKVARRHAAH